MQESGHAAVKTETQRRHWAKVVAKAWADPEFRERLEKDPKAVLKERGFTLDDTLEYTIVDKPPDMKEFERSVRPVEMAVAAGFGTPATLGSYGSGTMPQPPTILPYPPPTEGKWGACFGTPVTFSACISSGAAQPYAQPSPVEGKWAACIGTPVTFSACISSGAAQPYV